MNKFLSENTPAMKLARTIFAGVIGVIVSYATTLVGFIDVPSECQPFIVAIVSAIASPIMATLGKTDNVMTSETLENISNNKGEE